MHDAKTVRLEAEIQEIKKQIAELGEMRPGSLSKQMRKGKDKYGAYWHLSYTHRGKGRTQYIREEFVPQLQTETAAFKQFKKLIDRLVTKSIALSDLRMELIKRKASNQVRTRQS